MSKPRYNELQCYLQWRRQTRFIRHHGGPIMALGLFAVCLWFVWKACESRQPGNRTQVELASDEPPLKASQQRESDRTLQASKMPKW